MKGMTALGSDILTYNYGTGNKSILILGGVHGDEVESVYLAQQLKSVLDKGYDCCNVVLVPEFNVDGIKAGTRLNGRGVDLNRNMPTKDWLKTSESGSYPLSEPENVFLVDLLEQGDFSLIISLHSQPEPCINVNGNCLKEAKSIKNITGYEIVDNIGYPTPGCLGTYAGLERNIPTITYELERFLTKDKIVSNHLPALLEIIKRY